VIIHPVLGCIHPEFLIPMQSIIRPQARADIPHTVDRHTVGIEKVHAGFNRGGASFLDRVLENVPVKLMISGREHDRFAT
jgi:hypothetical protein